jgi:excisionase family DNA binding protein
MSKYKDVFLTIEEAAGYMRTTVSALRNLVWRKRLPAYKPNRRLLFKKTDLDYWIEKGRLR